VFHGMALTSLPGGPAGLGPSSTAQLQRRQPAGSRSRRRRLFLMRKK